MLAIIAALAPAHVELPEISLVWRLVGRRKRGVEGTMRGLCLVERGLR